MNDQEIRCSGEWIEKPLGFFDAPQLIQCRNCREFKPADQRVFRNVRKTDVFRKVCRKCEHKLQYYKSTRGKAAAARNNPHVPEQQRHANAAQAVVDGKKRLSALGRAKADAQLRAEWVLVRKAIAQRRAMLATKISASQRMSGGLWTAIQQYESIERYVRSVLGTYTAIIARMRSPAAWIEEIGRHRPPEHWRALGKNPSREQMMSVSPWDFATAEERMHLTQLDPDDDRYPYVQEPWQALVYGRGRTLEHHVYPHKTDPAFNNAAREPLWLREHNGYPRVLP